MSTLATGGQNLFVFIKTNKFWPPVARVDNVYGDKNIFCTCPSMDEFKEDAA